MELSHDTFDRLRREIHGICGLAIADDRAYLVRDRLEPVVVRHGWQNFEQLLVRLSQQRSGPLADDVVEAIVTRETSFFRDPHIYAALGRQLFPQLTASLSTARPQVRIWSAGAASGQEAYSLAMVALEGHESPFTQRGATADSPRFSILATDVCSTAVRVGQAGIFEQRELDRGISLQRRARFFEPHADRWRVSGVLRRMVEFRCLNLVRPFPILGKFDLICCRNVLIYFDEATRRKICQQFATMLVDGGWLLLGAAENLYGISNEFTSVKLGDAVVYRAIADRDARRVAAPG